MIFLTQETGFLKPIAWLLGQIFNFLFLFVEKIGIPNIGLCVILFTIIVRLIMMPLTIKQQKFSKLSNMMNPEIQAIQAKYKDKKDNESMMKMNAETKAVYEKYGTSPTGGCLVMLIQLPIMFALYRVIYKIPGYVSSIKAICSNIYDKISSVNGWQDILEKNDITGLGDTANSFIDKIYTFSSSTWNKITGLSEFSSVSGAVAEESDKLQHITNFFGINLTQAPGWKWSLALLIPLLAGLTQWLSSKLMENKNTTSNDSQQPGMAGSMKVMNTVMPIMSAFFCITFPACIGVYWITSSVVQIVQQIIINNKMNHVDVEQMVQANIDKLNAKRAKKGLPPKKITNTATAYVEQVKKQEARVERKEQRDEEIKKATDYYKNTTAKPGSLAAKANMVKMFNEKNNSGRDDNKKE